MSASTLIFAIPNSPPARFVSSVHDTDLQPHSISWVSGWWKEPETPFQPRLWTNLVVLPGEDAQLPAEDAFKMQDSWTVTLSQKADNPSRLLSSVKRLDLVAGHLDHDHQPPPAPKLGRGKAIIGHLEHWPERLKEVQKRTRTFLHEAPVLTIHLMTLSDGNTRKRYEDFVNALSASLDSEGKIELHAAGSITSSTGNAPGVFNEALLLRYASIEDFAASLKTGWLEQLAESHELNDTFIQASQLLVQELGMPAKDTKLDIHSRIWPYGDPYQRPGECFFG